MPSKRYCKGRFIGQDTETFSEGKVYRGKFDVYETFILFAYQSRVYRSSPDLWSFNEEWGVE